MLKIFSVNKDTKTEISPVNRVYNVYELGHYEIVYENIDIQNDIVFIEDIPVNFKYVEFDNEKITLISHSYFQDYFGFATLTINDEVFNFNIRIDKLKLSEIEDLFLFLWEKEENLFNIFVSKSTQKLQFKENGFELGDTSKFLNFIEMYNSIFEKLFFSFKNSPHLCLEKNNKLLDYNESKLSYNSIIWLASNLDSIEIDSSLRSHPQSFPIKGSYAFIDKMESEININSASTYENEIILGSFITILKRIKSLKEDIKLKVNIELKPDVKYAEFRDLKRLRFIKLYRDSTILERKTRNLLSKYKSVFKGVKPKVEKIRLTPVFATKMHYRKVYGIIRDLSRYRFDLFGEYDLLNITKLSTLYEVYNLYKIVETINTKLNISSFNVKTSTSRKDGIMDKFEFIGKEYSIVIFYEKKYGINMPLDTELVRISTSKQATFYNPDFIIEIIKPNEKVYTILDAKYSKFDTVKKHSLPECIKKYILNTGFLNNQYKKIDCLVLLYPSNQSLNYVSSEFYKPTISLIPSKPKFDMELEECLDKLIKVNLPVYLHKGSEIEVIENELIKDIEISLN